MSDLLAPYGFQYDAFLFVAWPVSGLEQSSARKKFMQDLAISSSSQSENKKLTEYSQEQSVLFESGFG